MYCIIYMCTTPMKSILLRLLGSGVCCLIWRLTIHFDFNLVENFLSLFTSFLLNVVYNEYNKVLFLC